MTNDRTERQSKKSGLGKGLNSLLGLSETESGGAMASRTNSSPSDRSSGQGVIVELDINKISPNPKQPRKVFDEEDLQSLAKSLKQDGLVQPVLVTKAASGDYNLIAGERRWRASKMAGLTKIPALVKDANPDEMLRIAIVENVQRSNLNVIEEAEAYQSLIQEFGLTQEQCADQVGKDRVTVANLLRILQLPEDVQADLVAGRLSMGHGRALLSLQDPELIQQVRDLVLKNSLSVRQTETLVKRVKKHGWPEQQSSEVKNHDLDYIADSLRSHLRTKVMLKGSGSRGRIEISYFSAGELERIMRLIGGGQFG